MTQFFKPRVLNLVASKSAKNRETSLRLVREGYHALMKDLHVLRKHSSSRSKTITLKDGSEQLTLLALSDEAFSHHPVELEELSHSPHLEKMLRRITDVKPTAYEELVSIEGVGAKTVRALALVSEVIYGSAPSYEDPARYSFAHGGKDEIPYPVETPVYDEVIAILQDTVRKAAITPLEKEKALKRLQ